MVGPSYDWGIKPCVERKRYICQKRIELPSCFENDDVGTSVRYRDVCYTFSSTKAKFLDFHDVDCYGLGLEPSKVKSATTHMVLKTHLLYQATQGDALAYWIGLAVVNGNWAYNDAGDDLLEDENSQWASGTDVDGLSQRGACAAMKPPGYDWDIKACVERHNYICQKDIPLTPCYDGDSGVVSALYNGKCYLIPPSGDQFNSYVRTSCSNYGAVPVLDKDADIHALLVRLIERNQISGSDVWIGLAYTNDEWTFNDQTTLGSFTMWADGQNTGSPQSPNTCVALGESDDFNWVIQDCTTRNRFICERLPPTPEPPTATACVTAPVTNPPATTPAAETAPTGCFNHTGVEHSVAYAGTCYTFSSANAGFLDFHDVNCYALGLLPVKVTNEAVHNVLVKQLLYLDGQQGAKDHWIGLAFLNGNWTYDDQGTQLLPADYNQWASGTDVDGLSRRGACAAMVGPSYDWGIKPCVERKRYICQKRIELPSCFQNDSVSTSVAYRDVCYTFSTTKAKFLDFHDVNCYDLGLEPSKVKSATTHMVLQTHLLYQATQGDALAYWIGLAVVNGNWAYNDAGDDLLEDENSQWASGTDVAGLSQRGACAAMKPPGYDWDIKACVERHNYICQKDIPLTPCYDGDSAVVSALYNGKCYLIPPSGDQFNSYVRTSCSNYGAVPVLDKDADIHALLVRLIERNQISGSDVWIGLAYTNDEWTFNDRTTLTNFDTWADGQNADSPQSPNTCVALGESDDFNWVIQDCTTRNRFICERLPPTPAPPTANLCSTSSPTTPSVSTASNTTLQSSTTAATTTQQPNTTASTGATTTQQARTTASTAATNTQQPNTTASTAATTTQQVRTTASTAATNTQQPNTTASTAATTTQQVRTTASTAATNTQQPNTTASTAATTTQQVRTTASTAATNTQQPNTTASTAATTTQQVRTTASTAATNTQQPNTTASTAATTTQQVRTTASTAATTAQQPNTTASTAATTTQQARTTQQPNTTASTAATTTQQPNTTASTAATTTQQARTTASTAATTIQQPNTTASTGTTTTQQARTTISTGPSTAATTTQQPNAISSTAATTTQQPNAISSTAATTTQQPNAISSTAPNTTLQSSTATATISTIPTSISTKVTTVPSTTTLVGSTTITTVRSTATTQTTSATPRTTARDLKAYVTAKFVAKALVWIDAYGVRNSPEFKDLKERIETKLNKEFKERLGRRFKRWFVTRFSQGSVIVDSLVEVEPTQDAVDTMAGSIVESLRSQTLGADTNFNFTEIGGTEMGTFDHLFQATFDIDPDVRSWSEELSRSNSTEYSELRNIVVNNITAVLMNLTTVVVVDSFSDVTQFPGNGVRAQVSVLTSDLTSLENAKYILTAANSSQDNAPYSNFGGLSAVLVELVYHGELPASFNTTSAPPTTATTTNTVSPEANTTAVTGAATTQQPNTTASIAATTTQQSQQPNTTISAGPLTTETTTQQPNTTASTASTVATTIQHPNTTASTVVTTILQPNTTASTAGTTILQPNTTVSTAGTTIQQPNTTASTAGTTIQQPNTTASTAVTTILQPNTTASTTGTTILQPNTTASTAVTTILQPNTTASTAGTTILQPNTTVSTAGTTIQQPNTTVSTAGTTIQQPNTTASTAGTTTQQPTLATVCTPVLVNNSSTATPSSTSPADTSSSSGCFSHADVSHSVAYAGTCYTFSSSNTNFIGFHDADCFALGLEPVKVTSEDVHNVLQKQLLYLDGELGPKEHWIALAYRNGQWVYDDEGREVLDEEDSQWASGVDVDAESVPRRCAAMAPPSYDWAIRDCVERKRYICQKRIELPSCFQGDSVNTSVAYRDVCYTFSTTPDKFLSFHDVNCIAIGFEAVKVKSVITHNVLKTHLLYLRNSLPYWIGLAVVNGNWVYDDAGTQLLDDEISQWGSGVDETDTTPIIRCAAMVPPIYDWDVENCLADYNFICQKDIPLTPCFDGDSGVVSAMYNGKCYLIPPSRDGYNDYVDTRCANYSAAPVLDKDADIHALLVRLIERNNISGDDFWIGLSYSNNEWTFNDQTTLASFDTWADGQDTDSPQSPNTCVALGESDDLDWVIQDCTTRNRFICEQLPPTPEPCEYQYLNSCDISNRILIYLRDEILLYSYF
ncbi:uncharacterized protein [Branchiostoma lanceolatum]|uniref:uncharacterized protein n=1 Tax=Branchiostoma lanceolatum TaxID=7740 RepID=UPI00345325B9